MVSGTGSCTCCSGGWSWSPWSPRSPAGWTSTDRHYRYLVKMTHQGNNQSTGCHQPPCPSDRLQCLPSIIQFGNIDNLGIEICFSRDQLQRITLGRPCHQQQPDNQCRWKPELLQLCNSANAGECNCRVTAR